MTTRSSSLSEDASVVNVSRNFLLAPHRQLKIGCWNVHSMADKSRTEQVVKEMERLDVDILGLSETRWCKHREEKLDEGITLLYSGRPNNQHYQGTGIMMSDFS